jgi:hypothetical protein
LASRGAPPDDLLGCARATGIAWAEIRKAEAALARAAKDAPGLRAAVHELHTANEALGRAYCVLAPPSHAAGGQRRSFRKYGPGRVELWRCRYCGALLFDGDRRSHLQFAHRVRSESFSDVQLEAHYTHTDGGVHDDDDDELKGW